MRRMSGFSLMEMMVVLLITAIVAAASAPMVNKKLMHDQAESGSPWLYAGQDNSIVYNVKGAEQTVSIGGVNDTGTTPALYIKGNSSGTSHILLKDNLDDDSMEVKYDTGSIFLTNKLKQSASESVVIGYNAFTGRENESSKCATVIGGNAYAAMNAVALGANASAGAGAVAIGGNNTGAETTTKAEDNAIAIGPGANSSKGIAIGSGANSKGIAIGTSAQASAETWGSIAIGGHAEATKDDSIAIGYYAKAKHLNSVAIGTQAETTHDKQIVLGRSYHTVYIPGNLVVDGTVILAAKGDKGVYLTLDGDHTSKPKALNAGNNGNARAFPDSSFNGITIESDRRLKNVGKAFVGGLEDVKKLEVFNYTYKKDPTKTPHVGVMAQDLEKIFPKAVFKGDDGFLRIRMEDMFYAVVNAIKELDSKFEALRNNEIKTLQKQVADLEKQNKELLKRIEKIEKNLK